MGTVAAAVIENILNVAVWRMSSWRAWRRRMADATCACRSVTPATAPSTLTSLHTSSSKTTSPTPRQDSASTVRNSLSLSLLLAVLTSCCLVVYLPSVLRRCWLGDRKGIRPVKDWVVGCWHGYLPGARCRLAHGPADATATHCLFSRTTWVILYQKGKTSLDLNEARDDRGLWWQWNQLDHMQTISTSLQTDNHTNTSSLSLFAGRMLYLSKHWRHKALKAQSTEGMQVT